MVWEPNQYYLLWWFGINTTTTIFLVVVLWQPNIIFVVVRGPNHYYVCGGLGHVLWWLASQTTTTYCCGFWPKPQLWFVKIKLNRNCIDGNLTSASRLLSCPFPLVVLRWKQDNEWPNRDTNEQILAIQVVDNLHMQYWALKIFSGLLALWQI